MQKSVLAFLVMVFLLTSCGQARYRHLTGFNRVKTKSELVERGKTSKLIRVDEYANPNAGSAKVKFVTKFPKHKTELKSIKYLDQSLIAVESLKQPGIKQNHKIIKVKHININPKLRSKAKVLLKPENPKDSSEPKSDNLLLLTGLVVIVLGILFVLSGNYALGSYGLVFILLGLILLLVGLLALVV